MTLYCYSTPADITEWRFQGSGETHFDWTYGAEADTLLSLYEKGKQQQWNAAIRIDWSRDLDPENPGLLDDKAIPIFGTPLWDKLSKKERTEVRRHHQAYTISQFLHGEQGALIAASRIIQSVPGMESKYYAATQAMDEARHVEIYSRLLREKYELSYPLTHGLKSLLESGLSDNRWDIVYLTMQVLIEGLALAAFQRLRDFSCHPLISSINAYVMQDEARHVAFGRIQLKQHYAGLSEAERDEREEFIIEGCHRLLDRFTHSEVWERLGLPLDQCEPATVQSSTMQQFRRQLFSRIVPTVKDIGLWGPRVQAGFVQLGVIELSEVDPDIALAEDDQIANEFDGGRRMRLLEVRQQLTSAPRARDQQGQNAGHPQVPA